MADDNLSINIKGPSELKLQIEISASKTVLDLKEAIAAQSDVEANRQRLIYSGRVLKDEDALSTYKIQSTHTVHMVKGAAKASDGSSGSSSASAAPAALPTMQSGQNPMDPLTQLNSHRGFGAMAGVNPFGDMGLNPNDPNMMQNMMNDPGFLQHMSSVMSNPEVMEQIMTMNPQLQGMAPQMREIMRSDRFREMMSNPESLRTMLQMSQMMQGGAGGGLGGMGSSFPAPGTPGGGNTTSSSPPAANTNNNAAQNPFGGLGGGFNPAMLGALGGFGGQGAGGLGNYQDPQQLQQMLSLLGGGGGGGGFGSPPAPADTRPPEERFEHQLQQMQEMGFTDAAQNIRALQASGGNVHSAVNYILEGNAG